MSNRFEISDTEYEQMQQEAYEYFSETEEPLTRDDEVKMYLDYAAWHLVYRYRQEPIPADDWAMIADAYVDIKNHPELVSDEVRQCFDEFATDHGCYWLKEPEKWAEVRYCLAKSHGAEMLNSDTWPDPERDIIDSETVMKVVQTPALCNLDMCIERREPWSKEICDDVKHSIITDLNCISADCQEAIGEYESIDAVIEEIDALRERCGLNGDEPNLPYYQQKELGFGASAEQIRADAKDKYDAALEKRNDSLREVYESVMAYKNRDLDLLPDYVKGDLEYDDFDIEADRLLLGFDLEHLYGDEYEDRFGVYGMKNVVENGIDFSKDAVVEYTDSDELFCETYDSIYKPLREKAPDGQLRSNIRYAMDISHPSSNDTSFKPIGRMSLASKKILLIGSVACDVLIERHGIEVCKSKYPMIGEFDRCVRGVYEADPDGIMCFQVPPEFPMSPISAALTNEYIAALQAEEHTFDKPIVERESGQDRLEKAQARLSVTSENDGRDIEMGG